MWKVLFALACVAIFASTLGAYWAYRHSTSQTDLAFAELVSRAKLSLGVYDPAMVSGLPEVARRYFDNAIEPGTPLRTTVRLRMRGVFLLGDRQNQQTYQMSARQVLSPPAEFVWVPTMASGPLRITGSDALVRGHAWTRFWINSLVPVVNEHGSSDLNRLALTRAAMESIWAPASLLPSNGAQWLQTGPNSARVTFPTGIEPIELTLAHDGSVVEVLSMRWSAENPDRQFRLQPFGGTVEAEARYGGFTIPRSVKMGNHYGTSEYIPFFQAEMDEAEFY
ncbi:MAG: hypothetical protein Devi2KO_38950 [Devosia indica]